jgi:hypothetical protein
MVGFLSARSQMRLRTVLPNAPMISAVEHPNESSTRPNLRLMQRLLSAFPAPVGRLRESRGGGPTAALPNIPSPAETGRTKSWRVLDKRIWQVSRPSRNVRIILALERRILAGVSRWPNFGECPSCHAIPKPKVAQHGVFHCQGRYPSLGDPGKQTGLLCTFVVRPLQPRTRPVSPRVALVTSMATGHDRGSCVWCMTRAPEPMRIAHAVHGFALKYSGSWPVHSNSSGAWARLRQHGPYALKYEHRPMAAAGGACPLQI